jgi:hypothetical protein
MKHLGILLACLVCVTGLVGVYYVGRTADVDDPLESHRVELQRAAIEQQTESIRLKQEQERQKTALLLAKTGSTPIDGRRVAHTCDGRRLYFAIPLAGVSDDRRGDYALTR